MAEENGKGTFWKVVGLVIVALLVWNGTQLLAVPTHTYQLQNHEARISEQERIHAAQAAAMDELIKLLKAEAQSRQKRAR